MLSLVYQLASSTDHSCKTSLNALAASQHDDLGPVLTYFLTALSRTSFHLFFSTSFFLARILKGGERVFTAD